MLIGDFLRFNAARYGDKIAFEDERKKLSFEQTDKRANALANALRSMGVQKGDRIAVLHYNCVEYTELLLGLPKAGFVMVPLNYKLAAKELRYIIDDSEANTLIFGDEFTETVEVINFKVYFLLNIVVGLRSIDPDPGGKGLPLYGQGIGPLQRKESGGTIIQSG